MDNNNKNWVCPHCFQVNKVGTTICTNCSGNIKEKGILENNLKDKWVCPKCQQINNINNKYCSNCEKINPALPEEEKTFLRAERNKKAQQPLFYKKIAFFSTIFLSGVIIIFILSNVFSNKIKISNIKKEYAKGNYEKAYELIMDSYEANIRDPEINKLLIETNIKRAEIFVEQGKKLFSEGKIDEALAKAENALELQPDYTDAQTLATEIKRSDIENYVIEALELLQNGKNNEALSKIQEAVDLDPNNTEAKEARRKIRAKIDGSTFSGFDLAKKTAKYDAENEEFRFSLTYKNNSNYKVTKAVIEVEIVDDSGNIVKTARGEISDFPVNQQKEVNILIESEIKYTQYRVNVLSVEYE